MNRTTCNKRPNKLTDLEAKKRKLAAALAAAGYTVTPGKPFNLITKA